MLLVSCNNKNLKEEHKSENITEHINLKRTEQDTSKLFQKIRLVYGEENKSWEEYEAYVSKKKDTFWNQWTFYKNGIIDSSKSKFYKLKIEGNKNDSILKGEISFYSPADSIPNSRIDSRKISLNYVQKENDSLVIKEIKTDKNIIYFDYKDYENLSFVGYISDLRFIKIDSMPEKLLLNRNYFAIDTEISTNNYFVELLE
jgi:hypothetical protein